MSLIKKYIAVVPLLCLMTVFSLNAAAHSQSTLQVKFLPGTVYSGSYSLNHCKGDSACIRIGPNESYALSELLHVQNGYKEWQPFGFWSKSGIILVSAFVANPIAVPAAILGIWSVDTMFYKKDEASLNVRHHMSEVTSRIYAGEKEFEYSLSLSDISAIDEALKMLL